MYQSISLLPNTIYCIHLSFLTSDRETTVWSITKTHTQWTPERVWGKWYNCSALPCFPPRAVGQGCYKLPLKAHLTGLHSNTEAQKHRHIPYIFFSTTRPKLFLQFVQWQAAIKMGQKESLTNCTQSNCDLLVLLDWTWLLCTRPRSPRPLPSASLPLTAALAPAWLWLCHREGEAPRQSQHLALRNGFLLLPESPEVKGRGAKEGF